MLKTKLKVSVLFLSFRQSGAVVDLPISLCYPEKASIYIFEISIALYESTSENADLLCSQMDPRVIVVRCVYQFRGQHQGADCLRSSSQKMLGLLTKGLPGEVAE